MHGHDPSPRAAQRSTARTFVGIVVVAIFAILGLLVAYNSGAADEEQVSTSVSHRLDSVRRRLKQCSDEVAAIESGRAVTAQHRTDNLNDQLAALATENKLYTEQRDGLTERIAECELALAHERKQRTGSMLVNASEDVLRLRYELKDVAAAIATANATRVGDRRFILRLIEAYALENAQLAALVEAAKSKAIKDARQSLNLSLSS